MKKEFKAESKRLLDLMIHSIYTHKEIFLRELISNASDAIDKVYYKALTDESIEFNKDDYFIRVTIDKENRKLIVSDTGIGMTSNELESNLGVIAQSGSLNFKTENETQDGYDIIGQFGVGFYSAFMVADVVTVTTKAFGQDKALVWQSEGTDGYTIVEGEKDEFGTKIVLNIKENTEDEKYDEFLDEYRVKSLIKKYSDFIRYPIKMDVTVKKPKKDSKIDYEDVVEEKTINSMVPIWRKNKNELTDVDYNNFYAEKRYGFDKPLSHLHISVDGAVRYNAILFIPGHIPFDYYSKEYEKGLELYSNGVLIMNKCADLLPDYFSFVKGMVDSEDLALNISREMLQHDRQLQFIAKNIKTKIKNELKNMLVHEREKYCKFFEQFGRQLKFGVYNEMGANKDLLGELLMFYSSNDEKLVTIQEYIDRMQTDQDKIYYASGENIDRIKQLPQAEMVLDKGYEILYLVEDVDEFVIKMMVNYDEKEFVSISSADLSIDEEDEKDQSQDNKELFDSMKDVLAGKVKEVRASKRLKSHPVCIINEGDVSVEMEKVLSSLPDTANVKADKILEINDKHQVFNALKDAFENDKDKFELYTKLLYDQALLIEGLTVSDPVELADNICKIMS